ncbi:MAG: hypothetical protein CMM99_02045 [Rickettsiales bacterium]|nr:hypothetical protein [Rickettsiales bacterium]
MKKKIFLIAGGSGGHFFPALSLYKSDEKKLFDYFFLVDDRVEKLAKNNSCKFENVLTPKFTGSIRQIITNFFGIILSIIKTMYLFIKTRPNLVIGFGGYTSIFPIVLAKILGIKTLIHEQNAILGKANRFLSKFGTIVAVTFKKTKFSPINSKFTGIPIRKKINIKKTTKKKILLIVGGSQGATVFADVVPEILKFFDKKFKKEILIIQQVRNEDYDKLKKRYEELGINCILKKFFKNIYKKISISDVVMTRCGSSTLAELQLFTKFAILFPLPSSMDDHQKMNAKEFKKKNECLIVNEKNIDYSYIAKVLQNKFFEKKKLVNKNLKPYNNSLLDLIKKIVS